MGYTGDSWQQAAPTLKESFRDASFFPYWWDAGPRPSSERGELPKTADVVIVGTGFTGLSAALTLSRAGRGVVALDAEEIGFGASTRNGGQVGPGNQVFTIAQLTDRFGRDKARRIYGEGRDMLAYFKDLIHAENIDCDLDVCGRFRGAVTMRHYDAIAREFENARKFAGVEGIVVAKADVQAEIRTDRYLGGVVLSEDGGVHPGRFHAGLLARAQNAGVVFVGNTRVIGHRRDGQCFSVATSRGVIAAREVIVATNGYTDRAMPFFGRRVVPVGSGIIATEPLGTERVARLLPGRRVYGDTRRVFSYFRPSPDGTRILFGGHCFEAHRQEPSPFADIYRSMLRTLPGLEGVRIGHAWSGRIGVSRDRFPHIGSVEGVHYAMGYSGTGVTRSTYFGNKVALKLLGDPNGATEFDDIPFQSHSAPARMPFVVNTVVRWMMFMDRVDALRTSTGPL